MRHLLRDHPVLQSSLAGAVVTDMADGGMGSLRFGSVGGRSMGRIVAEAAAVDLDQIPVLLSVNVDRSGELFELDIWKVDDSPLLHLPDPSEIRPDR